MSDATLTTGPRSTGADPDTAHLIGSHNRRSRFEGVAPYFQAAPLAVILLVFLFIPIATIVVVSFWDYDFARIIPDFVLTNYEETLTSSVTWRIYVNTLRYAAIV